MPVVRSSELPPELTDALRQRGLSPGFPGEQAEPGLIVADAPSAELLSVVSDASRCGIRILVGLLGACTGVDPWSLLDAGAADVIRLAPPQELDDAMARIERWSEIDRLVDSELVRQAAIGDSRCWREVLREAVEVARFTSSPMLISGETGTGKEVIARLVHALDRRPALADLVLVDCTTVVPSLSGSEFFGHEKGAFTGASTARAGAFARANGGTLFLDEIGELPITLQAELLRVVQEGLYKPVGGNDWRTTSFRLIAATNRNLLEEQRCARFRSDLYFRLAGAMIHLPSLRERIEDIVPLFKHFFAEFRRDGVLPELVPGVAQLLRERPYPGNVRDLRQLAARVVTRHVGHGPITPGDIPPSDRPNRAPPSAPQSEQGELGAEADEESSGDSPVADLEDAIRAALARGFGLKELKTVVPEMAIKIAVQEAGGPTAAARLLRVSRRAVDYRVATQREPTYVTGTSSSEVEQPAAT